MLKIRRPLGRLIFNMGIATPGKTVFLIETAPWIPLPSNLQRDVCCLTTLEKTASSTPVRWNSAMTAFRNNFSWSEAFLGEKKEVQNNVTKYDWRNISYLITWTGPLHGHRKSGPDLIKMDQLKIEYGTVQSCNFEAYNRASLFRPKRTFKRLATNFSKGP